MKRLLPAVMLLLGAVPLLVTRPAPLQDWPNHVARIHILLALLRGDAYWTQYYRLTGFLVPNAVLDLGIAGLARLGLPVGLSAQMFLVMTYAVFIAGFCALARAFDAGSLTKLCFAILLFYGNALFWGLVSYVLGLGLMLGLLALWLRAPYPLQRHALAALGAVALMFTHLVAALLWVVLLGCFDLCALLAGGRIRRVAATSWLAALLVVIALRRCFPVDGGGGLDIAYSGDSLPTWFAHKWHLFATLLLGGSLAQDTASLAALLVCAAVAACARPALARAPAFAVAATVLLTMLAPERVGGGSQLDTRLAIVPLLLLAAAIRIEPGRLALSAAGVSVLARTLVLAASWQQAGLVFEQYREQTRGVPAGSLMMMAYGSSLSSLSWRRIWSPPITSIATQLVFHDVFLPAIFANPAEQPIGLRQPYAPLRQPWNLSDPAHRRSSAALLLRLCAQRRFSRVFLTELYPVCLGNFVILDACRFEGQGSALDPLKAEP